MYEIIANFSLYKTVSKPNSKCTVSIHFFHFFSDAGKRNFSGYNRKFIYNFPVIIGKFIIFAENYIK
jgi:hypothetical protein